MDNACAFCQCFKYTKKSKRNVEKKTNPLRNWEKWLKERKRVQDKLMRLLKKPAGELLMNINEEKRKILEEKLIFANSQINTNFDKLRGNPEFWHLPPGLRGNRRFGSGDPIYFAVKSNEEKNEIPSIEYVGTPEYIFDEKHVLPRKRSLYNSWKKSSYRKLYLENMFSKLRLIEPHRPDDTQLIVLGKGLHVKNSSPPLKTTPCNLKPSKTKSQISFKVFSIPELVFIINGTVISTEDKLFNSNTKIRVIFNLHEIPTSPVAETLKFENKGLKTLRLYFRKFDKFCTFRDIAPKKKTASPFYFENSEIILVTGREFELPILFLQKPAGHFSESWEITTLPKIWNGSYKLIVFMQGIVYERNFEKESEKVRKMLDINTRNTLIKEILNNTLRNLKCGDMSKITFTFSEKELFECANRETYETEKKTRYLYNKASVDKLKEFYKRIKEAVDDDEWNYSIDILKCIARKKDVITYLENLTEKCRSAKNKLVILQNPDNTTDIQNKSKSMSNNLEDKPLKSESLGNNYKTLEILVSELERPSMIKNRKRENYALAYLILRSYIFRMCAVLEKTDGISIKSTKSYHPSYNLEKVSELNDLPERLIFERFDDVWIERTKRVPPELKTGFKVTPKPNILESISPEDTELVYDTYFHVSPKKGKSNKNMMAENGKLKGKSKLKNDSNVKNSKNNPETTVKECFDPFADIDTPIISQVEESSTKVSENLYEIEKKSIQQCTTSAMKYEKYIIVYTHLCAAVDAVVGALETLRENEISTEMLSELVPGRRKLERKIGPDEETSIENENTSENDPYFQCLVESHLNKNDAMNKYFMGGKTLESVIDIPSQITAIDPEPIPLLFKSHETLGMNSDESRTSPKSIGVQMSFEDDNSQCSLKNNSSNIIC